MKNIFQIKSVLTILIVMLAVNLSAQHSKILNDPKYGSDSASRMECANNLSIMNQYVKIKTYEYAFDAWRYCFTYCPEASKNIYIHGAKIIKARIEGLTDETVKSVYVDTLMLLYNQRAKYFQQPGYVFGLMGVDLLKYRKSDVEIAYGYLAKSIEMHEDKIDEAVAVTFISSTYALIQNGKFSPEMMINNYVKVMDLIDDKVKSGAGDANTTQAIESIEKIFAESGAANCESLVKLFAPKFEATPSDTNLLKKITTLLDKTNCESTDLFAKSSEELYAIQPTSTSAANLAILFATRSEFEKAINYYNKAIELETDSIKKAGYYYQMAVVNFKKEDLANVRKFARLAIEIIPSYGDAYLLIGNAYASSSTICGTNNFEKGSVFWAAVDQFVKAKNADPSVADKANDLINQYAKHFPNNEDAFFNGFTDGQSYKVGCWINESTIVRTSKN